MPYYMEFQQNGNRWQWGPLVPDNPSSQFGLDDRSIERKAKKISQAVSENRT